MITHGWEEQCKLSLKNYMMHSTKNTPSDFFWRDGDISGQQEEGLEERLHFEMEMGALRVKSPFGSNATVSCQSLGSFLCRLPSLEVPSLASIKPGYQAALTCV